MSNIVVIGFPEIVGYSPACTLCRLAHDHPTLLTRVHAWLRRQGLEEIASNFAGPLSDVGVPVLEVAEFSSHYSAHIDLAVRPLTVAYNFDAPSNLKLRFDDDERHLRKIADDSGPMGGDASDYKQMWGLFLRVMRRIDALESDPGLFLTPAGSIDKEMLKIIDKLVNTAGGLMKSLNKMRNSDALVAGIVEYNTRVLASDLAKEIAGELRGIRAAVEKLSGGQAVAVSIDQLLMDRLPILFRHSAETALVKTRDYFQPPN